jgi:acyl-CoA thioester hydrolase
LKAESAALEDITSVRVRYSETDAMGWVYYGVYLTYFEVGRTELIRNLWHSYRDIEDRGLRLPVVETGCRYLRGARYDDLLEIRSRMTLASPARIRFEYRITRGDALEIVAEGFTIHCFAGVDNRPMRLPTELRAIIEGSCRES